MNDEELTASLSIDDSLSVSVSSFSQNLNANLNPDGSLVVEKFQIDPANFTLGNLSNVAITSPVDDAYLYYDLSTTSWKNSATSLDDKIDNQTPEIYPFKREFGFGDYPGGGKALTSTYTGFGTSTFQYLGIPAPKGGPKRQRVRVTLRFYVNVTGTLDVGNTARYTIRDQIRYVSNPTASRQFVTTLVNADPDSGYFPSFGKRANIAGNQTEFISPHGSISLAATGTTVFPLDAVWYDAGSDTTIISYLDFSNTFVSGDTIYYSDSAFLAGNGSPLVTVENTPRSATLSSFLGQNQDGSYTQTISTEEFVEHHYDITLPLTSLARQIQIRTKLEETPNSQLSSNIQIQKIFGSVENF